MRPIRRLHLLLLFAGIGCGASQAPPSDESDLETGKPCAVAAGDCGQATCSVGIDNRCKTPVTCQLHVDSLCQTTAGEQGPATASSEKKTVLSGKRLELTAATSCGAGVAVSTMVDEIACF